MSIDDVHPSTDRLADLAADLLEPADATAARAHLPTCTTCRATYDVLVGLPELLAGSPAPPMPAEVTARVVAAIEREQIARAGAADDARSTAAARSRPAWNAFRRGLGARLGAGLLGAAAVLGGGYVVVTSVLDSGSDEPTAATSGSEAESLDTGAGGADEGPAVTTADTAYGEATLDEDVAQLLAVPESSGDGVGDEPATVLGPNGEVGDMVARAPVCVAATQRRADTAADPLAVDVGTYDGVPAVVVVLPEVTGRSGSADEVDVWVLGATCLEADPGQVERQEGDLDVLARRSVRP